MSIRKALSAWDDDSFIDNLVWKARLDKRWLLEVQHTTDYTGVLCIFDHHEQSKLLWSAPVGLAYGAAFGPDVADVAQWQEQAIAVVDAYLATGELPHPLPTKGSLAEADASAADVSVTGTESADSENTERSERGTQ